MKKRMSTILLALVFLVGLSLLLYPTVSDYWNSFHQSRAIASYTEKVSQIDNTEYEKILAEAREYNESLLSIPNRWLMTDEAMEEYESKLNVSGDGIMGYVEIESIDVNLPIYHGTEAAVLQVAVGHMAGASLPVGGPGTHCVLSGHRGLPSARLFTDLDKLEEGSVFTLHILDEVLTYEVDQILVVLPEDMAALEIDPEQDYCTLVTCTPYGVNSHRMLVRGHRIETQYENTVRVTAEAMLIDPMIVAPIVAAPMLMLLLVWFLIKYRKR